MTKVLHEEVDMAFGSQSTSPRSRCVVTRVLPGSAVERLRSRHDVVVWTEAMPPSRDELLALVRDADGLLSLLTDQVDAELMAAASGLRAISNYAVGFDNIDVEAATERGIAVGNTPDALTDATAELTLALLMARARGIVEGDAFVRSGAWRTWEPTAFLGAGLAGATMAIVGPGRIGRAVADRAQGLGMRVLSHGRGDSRLHLRSVLEQSDVVSLHCPLTPETAGLIGVETLAWMKPTAILVNTSRGGLVDLDALADALEAGRIGGAALDTMDPEPLPLGHRLLSAPRVTLTPHVGSGTATARAAMADAAVDNLLLALDGQRMRHPVNAVAPGTARQMEESR
jgi:glyoxylate reductase